MTLGGMMFTNVWLVFLAALWAFESSAQTSTNTPDIGLLTLSNIQLMESGAKKLKAAAFDELQDDFTPLAGNDFEIVREMIATMDRFYPIFIAQPSNSNFKTLVASLRSKWNSLSPHARLAVLGGDADLVGLEKEAKTLHRHFEWEFPVFSKAELSDLRLAARELEVATKMLNIEEQPEFTSQMINTARHLKRINSFADFALAEARSRGWRLLSSDTESRSVGEYVGYRIREAIFPTNIGSLSRSVRSFLEALNATNDAYSRLRALTDRDEYANSLYSLSILGDFRRVLSVRISSSDVSEDIQELAQLGVFVVGDETDSLIAQIRGKLINTIRVSSKHRYSDLSSLDLGNSGSQDVRVNTAAVYEALMQYVKIGHYPFTDRTLLGYGRMDSIEKSLSALLDSESQLSRNTTAVDILWLAHLVERDLRHDGTIKPQFGDFVTRYWRPVLMAQSRKKREAVIDHLITENHLKHLVNGDLRISWSQETRFTNTELMSRAMLPGREKTRCRSSFE